MSMHIGVQLVAPNGFEALECGRVYHLLRSDAARERVLLVMFVERLCKPAKNAKTRTNWHPTPLPVLVSLRRARFERALAEGMIQRLPIQAELPPWQVGLAAARRDSASTPRTLKRSHAERIDRIVALLAPLLDRLDIILGDDNPDLVINRYARRCDPPQNETRMRLWLYSYLCFGRNRLVLHYATHRLGRWDRLSHPSTKFGRKSAARGAQHGYGSNDAAMRARILDGYERFAGPGVHMSSIYRATMLKVFGCTFARNRRGRACFIQPDGEPIPNLSQFTYQIDKVYPLRERQYTKYGHARTRNRLVPSMGRYTESVGCLMERVEEDAFWVDEVSEGFLSGSHLPALVVARARCSASGMIVGIGFSLGGERASAYRLMKFCMAISKVKFCKLFGLKISHEEWPSWGLSPHVIDDRGPGSTEKAQSRAPNGRPVIKEITQSYAGQSKAIIESSNPRSVQLEGEPNHVTTRLTIPQLAVREIVRVIRDNATSNAQARCNIAAIASDVEPTPIGVWAYLDKLGRNDSIPMSFDDAVRGFLTPITLTVKRDGVYYLGQRFDSADLRRTNLLDKAPSGRQFSTAGYMFDLRLRHLWLEVGHEIIEVDMQLTIRDGADQLYVSAAELDQIAFLRRQRASELRNDKQAVMAEIEDRFEAQAGLPFNNGTRRKGRGQRRSVASKLEARQVIDHLQPKRSRS